MKGVQSQEREFLSTKARSGELRAAEADAWRKPASATEPSSSARPSGSAREEGAQREPVDEQPQHQPDVGDSEMAVTPDAKVIRRTRIVAKRSDPAVPTAGVPKRMRIWSKHSRPLTPAVVSEQPETRARIHASTSVYPETFAMMLESDGNLQTYTELNAVALDLHEPDPETMWSSDLGWVPKSILHKAREKEVKKRQQFKTYEEVPLAKAKGQEIITSRFVDKWEESGELRSRLVSRGYESSHADPASLFAATPSVVATRIACVLGLAQDVERTVADISGFFLHAVLEKHFFVTPAAEHRKPGVVWKLKRYLYSDKRAPRVWQDHFEKTMLELGFERLESEPSCFVKNGVTHKDTIIVAVHVDDLQSVGKRKHLDNFFVQLEKTLKLKRVEFIENGKSVLFLGDHITMFKEKITLKSKDTYVDNMLTMLGMESCKPTFTPMVRKESLANDDQELLDGSEAETYRSVVGILMYFKRHRFDLHYAAKSLAMASSSPTKGHIRRLKRVFAQHSRYARHASGIGSAPRTVDGIGWLV